MKLWIVGKDGMLGSALCELCKEEGISFHATSRNEADITDVDSLKKQKDFTHIINCAGYTDVEGAEKEREKAYQINVLGIKHLASLAKERKAKIVHFSTDYVFNGDQNIPYKENAACNPLSIYGKTKWEGEVLLQKIHPEALIIRTSWLFGRNGKNFVKTMVRLMREKEEISVVNDQWGRPTFASDLARVTLNLLPYSGIFHFANAGMTNWHEFAHEIFRLGDFKCKRVTPLASRDYPSFVKRPLFSVLCTEKIEKTLQISIRNWKDVLRDEKTYFF